MIALLLEAAMRSAALGLAVWGVIKVLRIHDAHLEKLVWTLVVAASLAMPALMRTAALPVPTQTTVMVPDGAVAALLRETSHHSAVTTALLGAYLSVTAILLIRLLASLLGALRLHRGALQTGADPLSGIELRISDAVRTPCTFARCIVLPTGFDSWAPTARAAALAHERSHVKHWDSYRLWLAAVYCCVFWFNPAAWLVRRRLQLLAELTSDQEALQCVGDAGAYAEMLVHLAAQASPLPAAVAMSGSTQLTARIDRIMENKMSNHRLNLGQKVVFCGAALAATVFCCSCVTGPHALSPAEDPKVAWVSGTPLSQFYPAALKDHGVQGYAVMKLIIDRAGKVTDASVVTEKPAGLGIGAAATDAARTFRFDNTLSRPVVKTLQVRFAIAD
jgi:beta-lactamase regulating signal transducer with metallopeptidase domain